MKNNLLYLTVARTATHVGCGQGLDDIDLPILRGKASGLPIVGASSIKGVLRQYAPAAWSLTPAEVLALFGPDRDNASAHGGMLAPQDARLLAMPVASLRGGWGWITCPDMLRRYKRDAEDICGLMGLPDLPTTVSAGQAVVSRDSPLRIQLDGSRLLALGEIVFSSESSVAAEQNITEWGEVLAKWAFPHDAADWRAAFAQRLVLITDDEFRFYTVTGTEVRSRVSLNEDRVADDKALWREECLPPDSLLWGVITASPVEHGLQAPQDEMAALAKVQPCDLQIGGKASVGYGSVHFLPIHQPQAEAP